MGRIRKAFVGAGFAVWFAAAAGGLAFAAIHAATPGASADAPPAWPAGTSLERGSGRPTVILFAHPMCPCTRASLAELERVVARSPQVQVYVVFERPETPGATAVSAHTVARAIPGVRVLDDDHARLAHAFHAQTSGFVVAYDDAGALLFSGGITGARGHEGDNAGATFLSRALARSASRPQPQTPVFGCGLLDRNKDS
jgi:hypothetical protein